MKKAKIMKKYARLIAEIGIGANNKQDVYIQAPAECYGFVRYLVLELYACHARSVSVDFSDVLVDKENLMHMAASRLGTIPEWEVKRAEERNDKNYSRIVLFGNDPAAFRSVDPKRMAKENKSRTEVFSELKKPYLNNELAWCIAGVPTKAWAKRVFPDLSPTQAILKLWNAIYQTCYVSEDNDPIEEWKKHIATLKAHAQKLNDYNFKSLHYTNELGTDLTVGLAEGHIWGSADAVQSRLGRTFIPNLPTEEVFTMPDRQHIDGIVYSSKPLSHNGIIIDKFWVRFKDGKAVDFKAEKGQDELASIIHFDENACSLGEAALVPFASPISQQNIVYQNTLYDENASCHLAFGQSFNENLKGGDKMSEEEIFAHGGNNSKVHVDFMVGSKGLQITGLTHEGKKIPVFIDGNFAF